MRGDPRTPVPEQRPISSAFKTAPHNASPPRPSTSRYAKPQVLMGEVTAPAPGIAPAEIAKQRQALRAVMLAAHLTPSGWTRAAGIAPGELLAFLSGRARAVPPGSLEKLAAAAGVGIAALLP
jgi:hypothetical protein